MPWLVAVVETDIVATTNVLRKGAGPRTSQGTAAKSSESQYLPSLSLHIEHHSTSYLQRPARNACDLQLRICEARQEEDTNGNDRAFRHRFVTGMWRRPTACSCCSFQEIEHEAARLQAASHVLGVGVPHASVR